MTSTVSSPEKTPSPSTPTAPPDPSHVATPPEAAPTGSLTAYTEAELRTARTAVGALLVDVNTDEVLATIARSTYGEAVAAIAPDVQIAHPPVPVESAVLVVRMVGPVNAAVAHAPGSDSPLKGRGAVAVISPTDGRVLQQSVVLDDPAHPDAVVPRLGPAIARDEAQLPLT